MLDVRNAIDELKVGANDHYVPILMIFSDCMRRSPIRDIVVFDA